MLIDKEDPPVALNVEGLELLKSKVTLPDLNSYAGSPNTAAPNCSAVALRYPE